MDKLKGKKTYCLAIAGLLTAIVPVFSGGAIDLGAADMQTIWFSLLAMTGRAAIKKAEK